MIRTLFVAMMAICAGACAAEPTACEVYCDRAGDCLGRPSEVAQCIDTCEGELASGSLSEPVLERCAACFEAESCATIAGGACDGACAP